MRQLILLCIALYSFPLHAEEAKPSFLSIEKKVEQVSVAAPFSPPPKKFMPIERNPRPLHVKPAPMKETKDLRMPVETKRFMPVHKPTISYPLPRHLSASASAISSSPRPVQSTEMPSPPAKNAAKKPLPTPKPLQAAQLLAIFGETTTIQ